MFGKKQIDFRTIHRNVEFVHISTAVFLRHKCPTVLSVQQIIDNSNNKVLIFH